MELFRFGGDFNKVEMGYALDSITANRLDAGLVDGHAINKLGCLVSGGVTSIDDLFAAELALRAVIFHDKIQEVVPSVKIQVVCPGQEPFVFSDSPNSYAREAVQSVLQSSQHTVMLCGVDQLIGFGDQVNVQEYLQGHEERRKERMRHEAERNSRLGIPQPSFSLDPSTAPIEFVASDKNDFFANTFYATDRYSRRFLGPLSTSGYAAYIGAPEINRKYEGLKNYNAAQFFDVLDKSWFEHNQKLRRRLEVPLPLFLSIVLSRSKDRESIPEEIVHLREEFADARRQLWELFDEADFRVHDTEIAIRILNDIEKRAASIVPLSLKAHECWFPIRFDWLGRVAELSQLGVLKDAIGFLASATANQCIRVDAASITQHSLQSVELKGLLEGFLTDVELRSIARSSQKP